MELTLFETPKKESSAYTECVRIWLKELHPGWTFEAVHGKKMNSIIRKIKKVCKYQGMEGNDKQVIASFMKMASWIRNDSFYMDKDLALIDSKFNEIVTKIQQGKNGKNYHSKNSAERFSDFAR